MTDEQLAAGIAAMLNAGSVAVVGASNDVRKVGYRPVRFLVDFGYAGHIYPINPKGGICCGLQTYPSLESLPAVPDLVVVAIGAEQVPDVVARAGRLGVQSVVILSSGFAETGSEGLRLQQACAELAQEHEMILCGPNSVGIVHAPNGLTATFTESLTRGALVPGSVAVVSQSGAYGTVVLAEARDRGMGVRTFISSGNEGAVGFGDYLQALIEDPEVRVVGGYLEGLKSAEAFRRAALQARSAEKPVVVVKAGRSQHAQAAARSHTGSIAGRDEAYDAAFRRFGVARVADDEELIDVLQAFDTLSTRPCGNRTAVVSMSGGAGALMSDLLEVAGLEMATFSPALQADLRRLLPPFASVSNPVDLTGQFVSDATGLGRVLQRITQDGGVDLTIVYGGLGWATEGQWHHACGAAAARYPVFAVHPLVEREVREQYHRVGVPVYPSAVRAVRSARAVVRWATNPWLEPSTSQVRTRAIGVAAGWAHVDGQIGETETKAMMDSVGLRVPRGGLAYSAPEAARLAAQLGRAVALKVQAEGLFHKTEAGGVALNVWPEDAAEVFEELVTRVERSTTCRVKAVRVEEMAGEGLECIVGVVRARPFGALIGVGLGGITVDVTRDMVFDLVPVDFNRAQRMITSLQAAPLLDGFRQLPPLDRDALADTLVRVSEFAADFGDRLLELDLNPVLVKEKGQGTMILDAVLTLAPGRR